MRKAEKYVHHFNRLNGKSISKKKLVELHADLKKEIESGRIDAHCPFGVECLDIEKRLSRAIKKMNGHEVIDKVELKRIPLNKNFVITQTAHGPEVVKGKKIVHYHHEDITYLNGLQNIQNDKGLCEGSLDGVSDTTYKVITDRILELMQGGELLWRKPWNEHVNGPTDYAHNYVSKHIYRGGNMYLNWLRYGVKRGGVEVRYDSPQYFSFKQVTNLNGKVKAGEKGWPVVYFKWLYKDLKKNKLVTKEEATRMAVIGGRKVEVVKPGFDKFPGLFYYTVFNYEQCEGLNIKQPKTKDRTAEEKIESAEAIVHNMPDKPKIKYEPGDKAYYTRMYDEVVVPPLAQFKVKQEFYSTLFHELIHSTGHPKRVYRERESTRQFGDPNYAFEELIAELGASFLCGESGILYFTLKNSAAYLKGWVTRLKKEMEKDPKFFLQAAGQAQKAADFILDRKYDADTAPEPEKEPTKTKVRKPKKERPAMKRNTDDWISVSKKLPENYSIVRAKLRSPVDEWEEDVGFAEGKFDLPGRGETKFVTHWKKIKEEQTQKKEVHGLSGFTTADQTPEQPKNLVKLPGAMGDLLGSMQRYKNAIIVAGETHSSKSELGKQIADAYASAGDEVAYLDWEQGGLESRDTIESFKRNVKPENLKKIHVNSELPRNLQSVKSLAKKFKVVVLDSGTKLNEVTNEWIDQLRNDEPNTDWVILMQQNSKGGTRGGTSAEFDAPVVIMTYRPDESDYKKNYAYLFKNRGNKTGIYYNISDKKILPGDPTLKQKES